MPEPSVQLQPRRGSHIQLVWASLCLFFFFFLAFLFASLFSYDSLAFLPLSLAWVPFTITCFTNTVTFPIIVGHFSILSAILPGTSLYASDFCMALNYLFVYFPLSGAAGPSWSSTESLRSYGLSMATADRVSWLGIPSPNETQRLLVLPLRCEH